MDNECYKRYTHKKNVEKFHCNDNERAVEDNILNCSIESNVKNNLHNEAFNFEQCIICGYAKHKGVSALRKLESKKRQKTYGMQVDFLKMRFLIEH